MEYNQLKLFLDGIVGPLTAEQIIDAASLLSSLGIYQHELAIENALAVESDSTGTVTLATIQSILMDTYNNVLTDHGIALQDANFPLLMAVTYTLYSVDQYGDPSSLVDVCSAEMSAEETLAEIVALMSQFTVEELLPSINSVEPTLIHRIHSTSAEAEQSLIPIDGYELAEDDEIASARELLRQYLQSHRNLLIGRSLTEGLRIGLPFDVYVESARETLETLHGAQVVRELYGMALASGLSPDDASDMVESYLPEFIADGGELLEAQMILTTELGA